MAGVCQVCKSEQTCCWVGIIFSQCYISELKLSFFFKNSRLKQKCVLFFFFLGISERNHSYCAPYSYWGAITMNVFPENLEIFSKAFKRPIWTEPWIFFQNDENENAILATKCTCWLSRSACAQAKLWPGFYFLDLDLTALVPVSHKLNFLTWVPESPYFCTKLN